MATHNGSSELTEKSTSLSPAPASNGVDDPDQELERTQSISQSMSPIREILVVGLLCSTQFVTQTAFSNTILTLHLIGDDLGITNPAVLPWLVAGFSLTVGTFILLSGRCGDLFGYKPMVIIGFAWFALWNVIAGLSTYAAGSGGQILFIFARVMGGIGPAILMPNALGILGSTYPQGRRKDMVFSLFAACAPVGAVVGGAVGGLWALVWWPWIFWTFGIALAVLGILSHFILPAVPIKAEEQGLTIKQRLEELDLLGAAIGITALILFNFAWNQAPAYGWNQPYVITVLVLGCLLFLLFFWIELKHSKHPLIPFDALSMDVSFVMVCEMCGWAAFGIWAYYFIQFSQRLQGTSPLLTIAHISPVAVSGVVAAIVSGQLISRIGPAWVMFIAMCAFTLGLTLTATLPVEQTYWQQKFVIMLFLPWGMDMSFPAGALIMSNAVAKRHQGMAGSLVSTVVNYSISIGVGMAATVEVHIVNGGTTPADELRGYRAALYLGVGFGVMGVFTSLLFLLRVRLRRRSSKRVS